ncbi:hypothetical protein OF376_00765 [Ureaplasma miroungigenitalium]|uniref:Uncharacterized protein n=1 Tax=Ureaplasma miroungigenitalium TaxID=1042321 RepID=A0ABT3BM44_9BACT|nr:hypothetical protein [Ureaplasma miroungigenitalium]MCV3728320.1 hypothetical protein [Ureaplasma miroungigenitalium]
MENWKVFELKSVEYLNQKYVNYFEHLGFSDSTTSDIKYINGHKTFFIEAKMPQAQSGQFVLLPDKKNKKFIFSPRNKSEIDGNVESIINFMNNDFDKYQNAGTKGEDIDLPQYLVSDWIINSYKRLGVKFFITYGKDFIIFPIERYSEYFEISCKYRVKKSGSNDVPKSRQDEVRKKLNQMSFSYKELDNFIISSNDNIDKLKFSVNDGNYMIRLLENNLYRIRKLSNTYNANVIFSIKLKKEQDKKDLLKFESAL